MTSARPPDLPARTFEFARRIVCLCQVLDGKAGVPRTLGSQLLRCGTSIGANVEETRASQSRADFVARYSIACREARETLYWLRLLAACGIVPEPRLAPLRDEGDQLVAILTSIVKKSRRKAPASEESPPTR